MPLFDLLTDLGLRVRRVDSGLDLDADGADARLSLCAAAAAAAAAAATDGLARARRHVPGRRCMIH